MDLDVFTAAYVAMALSRLREACTAADIDPDVLARMLGDCRAFQVANASDIAGVEAEAGRAFWLTRNCYPDSFWNGGWPKGVRRRLGLSANTYRNDEMYLDLDGLLRTHRRHSA